MLLAKNKNPTTRQGRRDRARARKKTHKLTEKHVAMIRSQKGKMTMREICKWFQIKTHYVFKVSPATVCLILNNKIHKPKEDKISIYDLIEGVQDGNDSVLDNIDVRDVKY